MRWLDKGGDEAEWPKDPRVDVFRESVWELSLTGEAMGWVTTGVVPMRSLPFFWFKQARMWTQVDWLEWAPAYLEEDYGPDGYAAEELRGGHFFSTHHRTGLEVGFDATAVTGPERDRLGVELEHGLERHNRQG